MNFDWDEYEYNPSIDFSTQAAKTSFTPKGSSSTIHTKKNF